MTEILLCSVAIFLFGVAAGLGWSVLWSRRERIDAMPIPPEWIPRDHQPEWVPHDPVWQQSRPPKLPPPDVPSPYAPKTNRPAKEKLPPADWPSMPKSKLQRGW